MNKLTDKNVRKLMRLGKASMAVTLPIEMIRELGWREKQKLVVSRIKGGMVIRDFRSK